MKPKLHLRFILLLLFTFTVISNRSDAQTNTMERVRINFTVPGKFMRPLLISFTSNNAAGDGYDNGYEALNRDSYPYDLSWLVSGYKCTIQGVGAFDDTKKYPLWLFMSKDENFEISLDAIENFDTAIDVFIYDKLENTYTRINESSYKSHISKGEYSYRFYLAFKNDSTTSSSSVAKTLSTNDEILKNTKIQYLRQSKELYINTNGLATIKEIALTNANGQRLFSSSSNESSLKLQLQNMKTQLVFVNIKTDVGQTTKQLIIH